MKRISFQRPLVTSNRKAHKKKLHSFIAVPGYSQLEPATYSSVPQDLGEQWPKSLSSLIEN